MKITLAPLVSDVRGRFQGSVFSSWKGIALVRRFQAPANPQSTTQVQVRNVFINLTRLYTVMGTYWRAAWTTFAAGKAFIGRNALIARNVEPLKGDANWADVVATPGDASTIPPASATFTAGAGQITVAITEPAVPTGWAIARAVAVAWRDTDPDTVQTFAALTPTEGMDVTSPYSIVLSGLTAAQAYRCAAFLAWTAPDASTRYSAAIIGTATPT